MESRICSIADCGKPHVARGWCIVHYQRWSRHGDPLAGRKTMNGEPHRYYRDAVLTHDGDDCLSWPYAVSVGGYGRMKKGGTMRFVHRLVCEDVNGPPPTSKHEAAHSCGNGHLGCVNPKHLSWKTNAENVADRVAHGTVAMGEKNGQSILSEDDVHAIRSMQGVCPVSETAAQFGVDEATIRRIYAGQTWAGLPYRSAGIAAGRGHLLGGA